VPAIKRGVYINIHSI